MNKNNSLKMFSPLVSSFRRAASAVIACIVMSAPLAAAPQTVGEYRFDDCGGAEWLNDYSINENTATGTKVVVQDDDKNYGCSSLSAFSSAVEVPHIPAYAMSEGAVSMLVYDHHNVWATARLLEKTDASSSERFDLRMKNVNADIYKGTFSVNLNGNSIDTGETFFNVTAADDGDLDTDWVHVMFTFGPQGMRLYVDGQLKGTNAYTGGFSNLDSAFQLPRFSGLYDEFYILEGQPSDAQVQTLYTNLLANKNINGSDRTCDCSNPFSAISGRVYIDENGNDQHDAVTGANAGGLQSDLLLLYSFDTGSGNTVYDISGVGSPMNLTIADPSKVNWLSGGGLSVNSSTILESAADTKLTTALKASNEVTLEAWIKPDNLTQDGPARIATFSKNTAQRNLTLGQEGDDYDFRLRTTTNSNNGNSPETVATGSVDTVLQHVVYTRTAAGSARIYVDGVLAGSQAVGGDLSNLNSSYLFALANELTENRAWLGEFYKVALYKRALDATEVSNLFTLGSEPLLPDVTVSLYNDNGTSNTTADDIFLESTSTGADGSYEFYGVATGLTYRVEVDVADTDLPTGASMGTPNPLAGVSVAEGMVSANRNFGFDVPTTYINNYCVAPTGATGLLTLGSMSTTAINGSGTFTYPDRVLPGYGTVDVTVNMTGGLHNASTSAIDNGNKQASWLSQGLTASGVSASAIYLEPNSSGTATVTYNFDQPTGNVDLLVLDVDYEDTLTITALDGAGNAITDFSGWRYRSGDMSLWQNPDPADALPPAWNAATATLTSTDVGNDHRSFGLLTPDTLVTKIVVTFSVPAVAGRHVYTSLFTTVSGRDGELVCSTVSDFGDAPESYGAASHVISAGLHLGQNPPGSETASKYSFNARADDNDDGAPRQPVSSYIPLFPILQQTDTQYSAGFTVNNTIGDAAKLYGWIDFDKSGTFEADEGTFASVPNGVNNGSVTLSWASIPTDIQLGTTAIRLRLTTDPAVTANTPAGAASNGEVEDFPIAIAMDIPANSPSISIVSDATPAACEVVIFSDNFNDLPPYRLWGANRADGQSIRDWNRAGGGADTYAQVESTTAGGSNIYFGNGGVREISPPIPGGFTFDADGKLLTVIDAIALRDDMDDITPGVTDSNIGDESDWGPEPVTLSRTFATVVGKTYRLYFKASPEGAASSGDFVPGIMRLDMPGGSIHFKAPGSEEGVQQYAVEFTATSTSSTIGFLNYGHVLADNSGWCDPNSYYSNNPWCTVGGSNAGQAANELIVDDVVLTQAACATGTVSGTVYSDNNGNNIRDAGEPGITAISVYLYDDKGTPGNPADDRLVNTTSGNATGGYSFANVDAARTYRVEVDVADSDLPSNINIGTTNPLTGVSVAAGMTTSDQDFGFDPSIVADYSDAPANGETAPDGSSVTAYGEAKHTVVAGILLGAAITDETSAVEDADNASDDGISVPTLTQGLSKTLTATVSGSGGYLQGWIDWNGDGDFADSGEQVATDLQLASGNSGTISIPVTVPANAITGQTIARFRWSTVAGLNSTISTMDGEVEDYALTIIPLTIGKTPEVCTSGQGDYANWSGNTSGTGSFINSGGIVSVLPNFSYAVTGDDGGTSIDGSEAFNGANQLEPIYGQADSEENLNVRVKANTGSNGSLIQKSTLLTVTFDSVTPSSGWAFHLHDIDDDQAKITAKDANGNPVSIAEINSWVVELFDPDTSNGTQLAVWDSTHAAVVGAVSNGVSSYRTTIRSSDIITEAPGIWFQPTMALSELSIQFESVIRSNASYHMYIASCIEQEQDDGGISGTVYTDSNSNNSYDSGSESGIGSVTVSLFNDANGVAIDTTSTATNGSYSFSDLDTALSYRIEVDAADTDLAGKTIGTTNPLTGVAVTAGNTTANQNFGFDVIVQSNTDYGDAPDIYSQSSHTAVSNTSLPGGKTSSIPDVPDNSCPITNAGIIAIHQTDSGRLFVGGQVTLFNGSSITSPRLTEVNTATCQSIAFSPFTPGDNGDTYNRVTALSSYGDFLIVGGEFSNINGSTRGKLAIIDLKTNTLLPWNPALPSLLHTIAVDKTRGRLHVGGEFGYRQYDISAITASSGTFPTLLSGNQGKVFTLHYDRAADRVFMGGTFANMLGSSSADYFASLNLVSNNLEAAPAFNHVIYSITSNPGKKVYLLGDFTSVGGNTRSGLAALQLPGLSVDTVWKPTHTTVANPDQDNNSESYNGKANDGLQGTRYGYVAVRIAYLNEYDVVISRTNMNTLAGVAISDTNADLNHGSTGMGSVNPETGVRTSWAASFPTAQTGALVVANHGLLVVNGKIYVSASGNLFARYALEPVGPQLYLGDTVDTEAAAQPSANADGDGSDEDGIVGRLSSIKTGDTSFSTTLKVTNNKTQAAYVTAWIDFNKNGVFEANEANAGSVVVNATTTTTKTLTWNNAAHFPIPAAYSGQTFLRVRVSTTQVPSASEASTLSSPDGEIEDYPLSMISSTGSVAGTVYTDTNANNSYDFGTESGIGSITVTLLNAANNTTVASTGTAANGSYSFANVNTALTYKVQVDTADTDLPIGAVIGTTNPLTPVTVTAGSTTANQNFGFDSMPVTELVCADGSAPTMLDWSAVSWNDGDTSNTYANVGGSGHDITFNWRTLDAAFRSGRPGIANDPAECPTITGDYCAASTANVSSLAAEHAVEVIFSPAVKGMDVTIGDLQDKRDGGGSANEIIEGIALTKGSIIGMNVIPGANITTGSVRTDYAPTTSGTGDDNIIRYIWNNTTDVNNVEFTIRNDNAGPGIYGNALSFNMSGIAFCPNVITGSCSTVVTTTADTDSTNDDSGSLRDAIECANSKPGPDTITFNMPASEAGYDAGTGVWTITPTSVLPTLTGNGTTIDAETQTGAACGSSTNASGAITDRVLKVQLAGSGLSGSEDGLTIGAAADITVKGLAIGGFPRDGLVANGSTNTTVICNHIGLAADGVTALANNDDGLVFNGVTSGDIGNGMISGMNVVGTNVHDGIRLEGTVDDVIIDRNYIGIAVDGNTPVGNGRGYTGAGVSFAYNTGNIVSDGEIIRNNVIASNGAEIWSFYGAANNVLIENNLIGTDATGLLDRSDQWYLIIAEDNDGWIMRGNVISGSDQGSGIEFYDMNSSIIQGNKIGVGIDGTTPLGNGFWGVRLDGGNNNLVGGSGVGEGNIIAYNSTDSTNGYAGILVQSGGDARIIGNVIHSNDSGGIEVVSATSSAFISQNSIYGNTDIGIDLGGNGVTANDNGDGDTGPNDLLNFPELKQISYTGTTVNYNFDLDVPVGNYTVEFFDNPSGLDSSGYGEGEVYLGSVNIVHSGGNQNFTGSLTASQAPSDVSNVVTTATLEGVAKRITSEFSAPAISGCSLVVTTTNDSNNAENNSGSLRDAIECANATSGADTITFNMPTSESGYDAGTGVWTISPTALLPNLTDAGTTIDATTQTGSACGDLWAATPGRSLKVQLDGGGLPALHTGLWVGGNDFALRGMAITNFATYGVRTSSAADNAQFTCNHIGIAADGVTRGSNSTGLSLEGSGNKVGGVTAGDGNVISGNSSGGGVVLINAHDTTVHGNFIGTASDGSTLVNNGIGIWNIRSQNLQVGGPANGQRNLISGNSNAGITFIGPNNTGNEVKGNYIGTTKTGLAAAGNATGINFGDFSNEITIGGSGVGEGNVISGNTGSGIGTGSDVGEDSHENNVIGNMIGFGKDGANALPNRDGITLYEVNSFWIQDNTIANNTRWGIMLQNGADDVVMSRNRIFNNASLGIDLQSHDSSFATSVGVTPNDPNDSDDGANSLINFPELNLISHSGTTVNYDFDLDVAAGSYRVEFFDNPSGLDSSGHGEGEIYLGSIAIAHTGSGSENFTGSFVATQVPFSDNTVVTTVTSGDGELETSEFSGIFDGGCALVVTTTADSDSADNDSGSLRDAIECANETEGADTITFNIPTTESGYTNPDNVPGNADDYWSIQPASRLPFITDPLVIAGDTQPGYADKPIIELEGSVAGSVEGLFLNTGSDGSTIRALIVNRFDLSGIELRGSSNHTVVGSYIGTDSSGLLEYGNDDHGVEIAAGSGNNTIGGVNALDGNIISGNRDSGIRIDGPGANIIQGNLIGLGSDGQTAMGNAGHGLYIRAPGNQIGGSNDAARNVIADSDYNGIDLSGATANVIEGNYIGTDITGTQDRGNHIYGIKLTNADGNTIGGSGDGTGNLISGNGHDGIMIQSSDSNTVQGNYIGTDVTGTLGLGNTGVGITLRDGESNQIGGPASGAGNVISANGDRGVWVRDNTSQLNQIQGNVIGANVTVDAALGNGSHGIDILSAVDTEVAQNTIAYNGGSGAMLSYEAEDNRLLSNNIRDNQRYGVLLESDAVSNQIVENTISDNGYAGIANDADSNNTFSRNSISSNGALGIDLGLDGVTENSNTDSWLNYPEISPESSVSTNGTMIVAYDFDLDVPANTHGYRVEFFSNTVVDPSGHGEGETYLGYVDINHAGAGSQNFKGSFNANQTVPENANIALTLTEKSGATTLGSTSEFSRIRNAGLSVCTDLLADPDAEMVDIVLNENSSEIVYLEALDAAGNPVTYAISGGADGSRFVIDPVAPGALFDCVTIRFINNPIIDNRALPVVKAGSSQQPPPGNYEAPVDSGNDNVYDLEITVTDSQGNTVTKPLSVIVQDVNEKPVVTSAALVDFLERQDTSTVVMDLESYDPDADDAEGSGLTYSISGGADGLRFNVDAQSGELRFVDSPDYGSPVDKNGDNKYELDVRVTDDQGYSGRKALTVTVTDDPDKGGVSVNIAALLQGPYVWSAGLMSDSLRSLDLLPLNQPYAAAPFNYQGTETLSAVNIGLTGDKAIVDWVLVELRSSANPTQVVAAMAAVLRRNGNVADVSLNGSGLTFEDVTPGQYYVSLRHRNHLDVMTATPLSLGMLPVLVDFSNADTPVYGEHARLSGGDIAMLWSGDVNQDNRLILNGQGSDINPVLTAVLMAPGNSGFNSSYQVPGYNAADLNMDGKVVFIGPSNDANILLGNTLAHPGNPNFSGNFIVVGGMP